MGFIFRVEAEGKGVGDLEIHDAEYVGYFYSGLGGGMIE